MAVEPVKTEKELYLEQDLGKCMFAHIVIINPRWKTMMMVEENFEDVAILNKLPKNQKEQEMLKLAIKSFTEGYEVVDFCSDCKYVNEDTERVYVQLVHQGKELVNPLDSIAPIDNIGKYLRVRESMFTAYK